MEGPKDLRDIHAEAGILKRRRRPSSEVVPSGMKRSAKCENLRDIARIAAVPLVRSGLSGCLDDLGLMFSFADPPSDEKPCRVIAPPDSCSQQQYQAAFRVSDDIPCVTGESPVTGTNPPTQEACRMASSDSLTSLSSGSTAGTNEESADEQSA